MAALRSSSSSTMFSAARRAERHLDHAHCAVNDPRAGCNHGGRLLAPQHDLGDLGRVGQPGDPGLDDVDAGGDNPGCDLGGELAGDLVGVVAQREDVVAAAIVIRVAVGNMAERCLALGIDERHKVFDAVSRRGRCRGPARPQRRRSRSGCRRSR